MKKKVLIISLIVLVILILTGIIGFFIYVNDYYKADMDAIEEYNKNTYISKKEYDGYTLYGEGKGEFGLIIYPGGKVESKAYEPLMTECAIREISCFLVDMPFNLAVFDINAADLIYKEFPDIDKWYIGGHSLGGVMAAQYVSKNTDNFDGLILLGAYSSVDISDTNLDVLSIYGSNDQVLDMNKYEDSRKNLPDDFKEYEISGGNHAYFGMYGEQDGDGVADISNVEQVIKTMKIISEYFVQFPV